MEQEYRHAIALMRYSAIAPLIHGLPEGYKNLTDYLNTASQKRLLHTDGEVKPGPSGRELFDFYTDRLSDHGSFEETKKSLRDAQTFLGCEILTLVDFLKEKGFLYEYLRYKYAEPLTEEGELPF